MSKNKFVSLLQEVPKVTKNQENPFYHSSYFDINQLIEVLKPAFKSVGVVLTQPLIVKDGVSFLKTAILDDENGEELAISEIRLPNSEDPQKIGSAITYYRRYSLQSLLGLEAEDDDGNVGSGKKVTKQNHTNKLLVNDFAKKEQIKKMQGAKWDSAMKSWSVDDIPRNHHNIAFLKIKEVRDSQGNPIPSSTLNEWQEGAKSALAAKGHELPESAPF